MEHAGHGKREICRFHQLGEHAHQIPPRDKEIGYSCLEISFGFSSLDNESARSPAVPVAPHPAHPVGLLRVDLSFLVKDRLIHMDSSPRIPPGCPLRDPFRSRSPEAPCIPGSPGILSHGRFDNFGMNHRETRFHKFVHPLGNSLLAMFTLWTISKLTRFTTTSPTSFTFS